MIKPTRGPQCSAKDQYQFLRPYPGGRAFTCNLGDQSVSMPPSNCLRQRVALKHIDYSHVLIGRRGGKPVIFEYDKNRKEKIDADHMEEIGKDRHLKVIGKEAKEVGGSLSLTVKGDVIKAFKANHTEQTTNDYYLKAQNIVIEAMQNITLSVGGSYIAIEQAGIEIKILDNLQSKALK